MKAQPTGLIWKAGSGMLGLALLLLILISLNATLRTFRVRTDMTQEKLYTLTDGTREIINNLDSIVTIKFFFSSSIAKTPDFLKFFAREIEDILHEYEIAGRGKIIVEKHDPRPDTEIEAWADRYGLIGQPIDIMGARLYLGLVAISGGRQEVISFIEPNRSKLMEYDITRLISRVSTPEKPVLGIISSLSVLGTSPTHHDIIQQQDPYPWLVFEKLAYDYDIRKIEQDTEKIDLDVDVLIAIHPKNLSDATFYAIDQFIMRGGRLLAFVDPFCLSERFGTTHAKVIGTKPFSDLGPLLEAWGVAYDPELMLADLMLSTPISRNKSKVENNLLFLTLIDDHINRSNVITAQLRSIMMPKVGAFYYSEPEGLVIEPLLTSSKRSQPVDFMAPRMGVEWIRQNFRSENTEHALALHLHGRFQTAFPEKSGSDFLEESIKPTTVILVGDVDMLYDTFAVQQHFVHGHRTYQPLNDNMDFLENAVEYLAGGTLLMSVRARGRFERPFNKVLELQQEAQNRWIEEERRLRQKLHTTRRRLQALHGEHDDSQRFILTPEQERELKKFRQEELSTQRELRDVRRKLREDIERLGMKLKIFNILFVPALVCIAGLVFGFHRQRKFKQKRKETMETNIS